MKRTGQKEEDWRVLGTDCVLVCVGGPPGNRTKLLISNMRVDYLRHSFKFQNGFPLPTLYGQLTFSCLQWAWVQETKISNTWHPFTLKCIRSITLCDSQYDSVRQAAILFIGNFHRQRKILRDLGKTAQTHKARKWYSKDSYPNSCL